MLSNPPTIPTVSQLVGEPLSLQNWPELSACLCKVSLNRENLNFPKGSEGSTRNNSFKRQEFGILANSHYFMTVTVVTAGGKETLLPNLHLSLRGHWDSR